MMADVAINPDCNDPKELFGQGVRAYILQDYEVAVTALSKASELLVEEHKDDTHESLADVYLYYGKALLGVAREQNEALGDAVPKNADDSDEDEEQEDGEGEENDENEEAAATAAEENNTQNSSSASSSADPQADKTESNAKEEPKVSEENSEKSKNNEEKMEEASSSSGANSLPGPSTSNGKVADDQTEQNGDDEPTDLQVAWEVLELAKKIFQKQEDQKKKLAETLIVLGEISLESENFQSAINDMKQGLEIQKEIFSKDSRTVAETLYKLGMAYSTNSEMDEAIQCFNSSLEYLKNRIKVLEESKPQTQEHKDEIEEIKGLIPDIEEKISDVELFKDETIKKITEAVKEPSKPSTDGAGSSKQASDISHLVKRKRKLEEVDEKVNEDVPAKKPAT